MIHSPFFIYAASIFGALAIAITFLFIGWRFGRESQGRPMFGFQVGATPGGQPYGEASDEGTAWDDLMRDKEPPVQ